MSNFFQHLKKTLKMIQFSHSVFAMPFALSSVWIASRGMPAVKNIVLIIMAMVTARNAAMTFNRLVDRKFDAQNPRTAQRELVSGQLSVSFATQFLLANIILFIVISYFFNTLTLALSPVAIFIILGYSLTKRFTHYTQFFLGLSLGISPLAAWIAITGTLTLFPILLGLAVFFWVAGFDLIYSTQDYEFDKTNQLKNIVVKYGIKKALLFSRILHAFSIVTLLSSGVVANFGIFYFMGIAIMAAVLVKEHRLIGPNRLDAINKAFFTLNGYVAVIFFFFVLLELYI